MLYCCVRIKSWVFLVFCNKSYFFSVFVISILCIEINFHPMVMEYLQSSSISWRAMEICETLYPIETVYPNIDIVVNHILMMPYYPCSWNLFYLQIFILRDIFDWPLITTFTCLIYIELSCPQCALLLVSSWCCIKWNRILAIFWQLVPVFQFDLSTFPCVWEKYYRSQFFLIYHYTTYVPK